MPLTVSELRGSVEFWKEMKAVLGNLYLRAKDSPTPADTLDLWVERIVHDAWQSGRDAGRREERDSFLHVLEKDAMLAALEGLASTTAVLDSTPTELLVKKAFGIAEATRKFTAELQKKLDR